LKQCNPLLCYLSHFESLHLSSAFAVVSNGGMNKTVPLESAMPPRRAQTPPQQFINSLERSTDQSSPHFSPVPSFMTQKLKFEHTGKTQKSNSFPKRQIPWEIRRWCRNNSKMQIWRVPDFVNFQVFAPQKVRLLVGSLIPKSNKTGK
jgi:hypothetical protein